MSIKGSSTNLKAVKRRVLHDIAHQRSIKQIDNKLDYMEAYMYKQNNNESSVMKKRLSYFRAEYKSRWASASRRKAFFWEKNEIWLEGQVLLPITATTRVSGRPKKSFDNLSDCSKRRATIAVRNEIPHAVLSYATQMSLRAAGKFDASKIVKAIGKSPTRASKMQQALKKQERASISALEALCIFVEADLTRRQYNIIRSADKHLYPSYSILQRAKNECYPKAEAFTITSNCAEVNLQDLVDHTSTRLCHYLRDVLESYSIEEINTMELIYKWGFDGSQQNQYKQKFYNNTDSNASIVQSSLVPICLKSKACGSKELIWQNPTPSSPRYCRPIRIRFVSKSTVVTTGEIEYVKKQIVSLRNTELPDDTGCIMHTLLLTMIDGKVCNAITQTTSTMRCYLCGASIKEFNNLKQVRPINEETATFGLSVLHARIRFFEGLLHLSYKLPIKKWQARSTEHKTIVAERKKEIQQEFRRKMGLLVDIPKAGYGNTNDGNTSRRFFSNPDLSADITGVDRTLIKKLDIILEAISSGHSINLTTFSVFTRETAEYYISLYPWYPMSPTLHKILVHGPEVVRNALVLIGQLSEEAAEARNKHFRQYRHGFARKFSREACNRDVINRLLLSSDPLITSMRPLKKKKKPFSEEALKLLIPNDFTVHTDNESSGSSSEEEIEEMEYSSSEQNCSYVKRR